MKKKIFLQLFANANVQTTLLNAPGNDLSPEMKTYYDMRLIDLAGPNLVHDQFGQKKPIPRNGGKTIEFRKYDSLPKATTPLTEGVTPDGNHLNVSAITATVSQYGDYITISDVLQLTAIDNNITEALKQLGDQAGRTLDTITRDVLAGGTNVNRVNSRSSRASLQTTDTLKPIDFMKAVAQLQAVNAPKINGSYVAIIHPYAAFDLMSSSEWIAAHTYTDQGITQLYEGEIGQLAGVRFVSSTEAKVWKDSSCPNDIELTYGSNKTYANVYTSAAHTTAYTSDNEVKAAIADGKTLYDASGAAIENTTGAPTVVKWTGAPKAVFSTLVIGQNAYGVTEVEGGGLQTIVKPLGAGDDPLNMRATVGWKAMKTAERLVEQYMLRIESCSAYSSEVEAN